MVLDILEFDEDLENLIRELIPHWREIRLRKRDFRKISDTCFVSASVLLVGERSLLCTMDAKTPSQLRVEYYPIYLKDVDQGAYPANEWITLTRSGGMSELEQKVQWLFEKPSMRLLISEEQCADGLGPDAQQYLLRFYGGLEISNPKGRGSLRITSTSQPDFTVRLSILS